MSFEEIEEIEVVLPDYKINYNCGRDICNLTHRVFTDGSTTKNGSINAIGGYAAIFVSGPWKDKLMLGLVDNSNYKATNIRSEGMAILVILENLLSDLQSDNPKEWKTCQIITDSQFWKDMFEKYMKKWSDKTFKEKANPDLTIKLWKLWNDLLKLGKKLEIIWTPAHNKKGGKDSTDLYEKWCFDNNNCADVLAVWCGKNLDNFELIIID